MARVLIVDGGPPGSAFLGRLVEGCGHMVLKARDRAEALELAQRARPDLVLCDVLTPAMDGFELLRQLRADASTEHIPVILLTGAGQNSAAQRLVGGESTRLLAKACKPEEVVAAVTRALAVQGRTKSGTRASKDGGAGHPPLLPAEEEVWMGAALLADAPSVANGDSRDFDREQADQRMRMQANMLDRIGQAVFATDLEGRVIYANRFAGELYGWTPEELLGQNLMEVAVPQGGWEQAREVMVRVQGGESWSREVRLLSRQGRAFTAQVIDSPLLDEKGRVIGIIGISVDLSARKAAEEVLRGQAELLDLAQDAIIVCDLEGRIEFWNRGAEHIYGWKSAEAYGQQVGELLQTDPQRRAEARKTVMERGEWKGELEQVRKDGTPLIVISRWTLGRDAAGQPRSILITKSDITEQRGVESQLLRAQRLESVGALASGLAHDLNNTLAPILMCAPLLRTPLPPERIELIISTIVKSGVRAAGIVKQVLTFSRGSEKERRLVPIPHLLSEMAEIASATFSKAITVKTSHAAGLWEVVADVGQLQQVLMNLCVNARDAMPAGGTLTLSARNVEIDQSFASMIRGGRPGCYVLLETSDTGGGIPSALLDRIFEPFFTTKAEGKGTGLGLASVAGIVKSHEGFMSVRSEPGRGTTFQIYLPVGLLDAPVYPASGGAPPAFGQGQCILIVDDEPSVLATASLVLEIHGYTVRTAADGTEAIAIYAEHRAQIAAVLTDIAMPYMDGVALVRALQRINPAVRAIVSTGQVEQSRLAELKTLHVTTLLEKPYLAHALLTAVHALLNPEDGADLAPVQG